MSECIEPFIFDVDRADAYDLCIAPGLFLDLPDDTIVSRFITFQASTDKIEQVLERWIRSDHEHIRIRIFEQCRSNTNHDQCTLKILRNTFVKMSVKMMYIASHPWSHPGSQLTLRMRRPP